MQVSCPAATPPNQQGERCFRHFKIADWLRTCAVLSLLVNTAVIVGPAMAQEIGCNTGRNVRVHALDEMTWRQLNRINEQVSEQRYDEAQQELDRLLTRSGGDEYLEAIVYQALGQVAWSQEHYESALANFEKALDLDILPDTTHFALMYQVAQLYYLQERYVDSLKKLERWLCHSPQEETGSTAWVLKASIHSRMNDYINALASIDTAISLDENPQEQWYQLKLAAHFELEQYPAVAATLEAMVALWPQKKEYWIQLSQVSYKLKQSEKALAVMALAYRNHLLDSESDLLWLSSLYTLAGIPYKAAVVIQKGMDDGVVPGAERNWLMVADSWYRAEELELALQAYRKAGAASEDGNVDLRRAYILVDLERWGDALAALNAALDKDGLDQRKTAEAYLLRGVAHFNLKKFDDARSDWVVASRFENSRDAALQWLNYLREERSRQAS
jgi:tetratricopeptide (TPR) repeat protein